MHMQGVPTSTAAAFMIPTNRDAVGEHGAR